MLGCWSADSGGLREGCWGPEALGLTCVLFWGLTGVIKLPYAEIEEPFEAWYNLTGNKSRIQYYGGKRWAPSCSSCAHPCTSRTPVPQFPFPWHRAGDNLSAGSGEALRDEVQDHAGDDREGGEHQEVLPAARLRGGCGHGSERLPQHEGL